MPFRQRRSADVQLGEILAAGRSSALQGRLVLCRHRDPPPPINIWGSEQKAAAQRCAPLTQKGAFPRSCKMPSSFLRAF